MDPSFTLAPAPLLYFGKGKISHLPGAIKNYGSKFLLVTGSSSFVSSDYFESLRNQFASLGLNFIHFRVEGEPTPAIVDDAVHLGVTFSPDVVVAIGGGSALDSGKAISAMIPIAESVKYYLEGVGSKTHSGAKVPFIAIPTTAGTGSEAARNAVLSETGPNGYKRSLRHNNFVPDVAIIDPTLTLSCPPETTSASGMDAFTQLLESYLSPAGNVITDAMALKGLTLISSSLIPAYENGSNLPARTGMALAAYLSGVTLTNAGLGLIHGFASAIGGYFPIAHGEICSALMAPVNKLTVRKLRLENDTMALKKYATVGRIFSSAASQASDNYYIDGLLDTIQSWTWKLKIPSLQKVGIAKKDFDSIVTATDNKNNPTPLTSEQMHEALELGM